MQWLYSQDHFSTTVDLLQVEGSVTARDIQIQSSQFSGCKEHFLSFSCHLWKWMKKPLLNIKNWLLWTMTYRILISVTSFLFMYLPKRSGFVTLKPFAIPYSAVTWAMNSNSSSCSESITELLRLVYQSHINPAQNSVYQSPQALLQKLQGLTPHLKQQPQHLVTPCTTGSPAISCNFILTCCFLSWHISSLWYLLIPHEQGLKLLLKMQMQGLPHSLPKWLGYISPLSASC